MLAAIYTRVSTEEQAKTGFSLPEQLNSIKEYCNKNGYGIYKTYSDDETGKKENRPQLQEMLLDAKNKCFNAVIVWKFDRFSRNREFTIRTKNLLRKTYKIDVISITEDIPKTPEGIYLEAMLEANSEFEVLRLAQRVKMGMLGRAKEGLHMGQMPYGYYVENGKVFINEDQANIIRKVFELYNSGWGHLKIARWLNENMVPTYKGKFGSWQTFQVNQMLSNEKYIGINKWDGTAYETNIPVIVDEDIFNFAKTQHDIKKEKYTYRGKNYDKFLFLGLLICGECNSRMRIKLNNAGRAHEYYAYMCYNSNLYRNKCTNNKLYRQEDVDYIILKGLKTAINKMDNISIKDNLDPSKYLESEYDRNKSKLDKAFKLYIEGYATEEQYKSVKKEIDQRNSVIEKELTKNKEEKLSELKNKAKIKANTKYDEFKELKSILDKKQKLLEFIDFIKIYKNYDTTYKFY
jgi:site-specific DNA recombinase